MPMSVMCDTSPHQSTEACERTQDLFQRGACVDVAGIELHAGVSLLCACLNVDTTSVFRDSSPLVLRLGGGSYE